MLIVWLALLFVTAEGSSGIAMGVPLAYNWGGVASDSNGQFLFAAQQSVASPAACDGNIYYSHNGGSSWLSSTALPSSCWATISTNGNGQYVFSAGPSGMYISSNFGIDWIATNLGVKSANDVAFSAISKSGSVIVTSRVSNGCVSYSNNFGIDWTNSLGPSSSSNCGAVSLDSTGSSIVVVVEGSGLYLSTDGGVQWTLTYDDVSNAFSSLNACLASSGNIFFAVMYDAPNYLLTSFDGGNNWIQSSGTRSSMYSINSDSTGNNLFVNGLNALEYSTNGGNIFEVIDNVFSVGVATMNSAANVSLWTQQFQPGLQLQTLYLGNPNTMGPTSSSSSPCPTSCPSGYTPRESWELNGVTVYCQDQPTAGQCLPGGSGCTSSCALAPGIIAAIVIGVLLVMGSVIGISVYFCCCRRTQPMATLNETTQGNAINSHF